ncbi:MAG TPA: tetratricopeptide repeat protein [Micropepsaceae bacterium]|nr:tetratricopeptide repeat protein [Micropepsaceae bacterium]
MVKRSSPGKKTKASAALSHPDALRFVASLMGQLAGQSNSDAVEAAQDVMWDAWDANDRKRRIALAKKALEISPLCADAYVLLAQEAARTPDEAVKLYCQGVEAGEKALGKAAFQDDVGHFWGILETRPYMRARHGLAMAQWELGLHEEAVAHYQDMLRLNPGDNQGIRYTLLNCFLELGRDTDASKLLKRYKGDGSAYWTWSGALSQFRRDGDCPASRKAILRAIGDNTHVAPYLLGRKKLPRSLPAFIGMGDDNEAVAYVHDSAAAWNAAPGALAWLDAALRR